MKNQFYLYLEFYIYFLKVYGQCPLFFCTDICSLGLNFLEFLGVSFMDPDPNFPGWIPMFGWSWSGSGLRIKNSNPDSEKGHGFKRLFFYICITAVQTDLGPTSWQEPFSTTYIYSRTCLNFWYATIIQ